MRSTVLTSLLLGLTPAAFAADLNHNGCQDAYEPYCVDVTATVGANTLFPTTGAVGSVGWLQGGASVGPGVTIGTGVVIGRKATIAGSSTAATGQPIGDFTAINARATIGADANLAPNTIIGRANVVGNGFTTGTAATMGYAATAGDNVNLGAGGRIANLADVGSFTVIGPGARVGRAAIVDAGTGTGAGLHATINGVIAGGAHIATGVLVDVGATVRGGATVAAGATINTGAFVGRAASIGAGATIDPGAAVRARTQVCDGATVTATDNMPRGGTWPVSGCTPPISCKAILNAGASTGSHAYTIDPDGAGANAPLSVYCDMVTDGGGWTFFAHVNNDGGGNSLFNATIGTYSDTAADTNVNYTIGSQVLPFVGHTEMMLTYDTPDAAAAAAASKVVSYQYAVGHSGFNSGPIPCVGLTNFSYRTALTGPYTANGYAPQCGVARWDPRDVNGAILTILDPAYTSTGTLWGAALGGDDSWHHDGYWYVR